MSPKTKVSVHLMVEHGHDHNIHFKCLRQFGRQPCFWKLITKIHFKSKLNF